MQLRMAGIMESGPGLLHIRRCHGVVERTQGEPTYVTVWLGEVGRGGECQLLQHIIIVA